MHYMKGTAPNGATYTYAHQPIPDYMEGEEWSAEVSEINAANREAREIAIERAMKR